MEGTFPVCNASVSLAELKLESLFWPARRQRYKEFWDSLSSVTIGVFRRTGMYQEQTRTTILWILFICLLTGILHAAATHPLDALDASEIPTTTAILRAAGHADDNTFIASITLQEPVKSDVLGWERGEPIPRKAKAILRRNAKTFEALVDLTSGKVLSYQEMPGAQAFITFPEILSAIKITAGDPKMQEGFRKRGITDFEKLFCAPRTAGNFGKEIERTKRIVKVDCFDMRDVRTDVFAKPIEGLFATVDLDRGQVLEVTDLGVVPVPGGNSELDPASM